jgi:hypothetical protein
MNIDAEIQDHLDCHKVDGLLKISLQSFLSRAPIAEKKKRRVTRLRPACSATRLALQVLRGISFLMPRCGTSCRRLA